MIHLILAAAFGSLLADAAAVSPSALELVLKYVVTPAIPLLIAGVLAALGKLTQKLHAEGKASKAALVGATFAELASSAVAHLDAEMRPRLQAALADGKITAEEGAELKAEAMRILKEHAPADLKKAAEGMFGAAGLDIWLSGLVERAVLSGPNAPPVSPQ